jgi:hypothetical protein
VSAEILIARIESAEIEIEDHGMLTLWLHLKHWRGNQGFGGFAVKDTLGVWMNEIFKICEVYKWSEVKGHYIRIRLHDNYTIEAIGHPFEEIWFSPRQMFAEKEVTVSLDDIEKHFGDEPPRRCRCGCGEAQGQCHFSYEEEGK